MRPESQCALAALAALVALVGCGSEAPTPSAPPPERPAEPTPPPRPETASAPPPEAPVAVEPPATRLAPFVAIDTHSDTPQRMLDDGDDITTRLADGHLDLPRMREGRLTAVFMSIWVDPRDHRGEAAWAHAQALIRVVRAVPEQHPDVAVLCTDAPCVRRANDEGRIALLMGIEGAHALGDADEATLLSRLREAYASGVRYMTVTWTNDNVFAHASSGAHPSRGLTDMGRRLVAEMNALGMIVDVSHVSDRTVSDVLDVTTRPVLASHSSARALSEHPRNLPDALIRRIAEGGGAVCINYYAQFVDARYGEARRALEREHRAEFDAIEGHSFAARLERTALVRRLAPELRPPTIRTLADHFAHVVELGGPGAACMGSDFDGVGELPEGMRDVSDMPALYAELERRGLPVAAIAGENVLRVLDAQRPR